MYKHCRAAAATPLLLLAGRHEGGPCMAPAMPRARPPASARPTHRAASCHSPPTYTSPTHPPSHPPVPPTCPAPLAGNEDEEYLRLDKDYRNLSFLITTGGREPVLRYGSLRAALGRPRMQHAGPARAVQCPEALLLGGGMCNLHLQPRLWPGRPLAAALQAARRAPSLSQRRCACLLPQGQGQCRAWTERTSCLAKS